MTFNDTWEYSKITNDFLINRKRRIKGYKEVYIYGNTFGKAYS